MPLRRRRNEVELMRELASEPPPPCKLLLLSDSASAPPKREVPTDDLPRRALAHAEAAGGIGVPPRPDDIVTGEHDAAPAGKPADGELPAAIGSLAALTKLSVYSNQLKP